MNRLTRIKAFAAAHKIKLALLAVMLLLYWLWLPARLFNEATCTVLTDRSGRLLSARIAADGQWRFPECDSVPLRFRHCILAFEDEYFYRHPGINPISLFKSLGRNISAGHIRSGGSTITMQLARMMRHNPSRTYYNKAVEMALALRIELSYRKQSILNLYCSHAPFGSNVVGLPAAAWRYFGRQPEDLSWAESALLAVLPNAPALIYPGHNAARLLSKRNRLLSKLRENRVIDEATYHLSLLEPLPGSPHPLPQEADHLLSRCNTEQGASRIYRTTLNKELQQRVSELLDRHVQSLSANQVNNACALVADVTSGEVLAYVGNSSSVKAEHDNYVDIIRCPRSTGSILKPFLYAFMLSEHKLLPAALVEDIPTQIGSYSPKNFHPGYDGLVPANNAIARSLNVPAVKMLQEYGNTRFYQRLRQLGFSSFTKPASHYGLSLILGGGEASLWDVASAYASLGRALNGYSSARKNYAGGSYRSLHYLQSKLPVTAARQNHDLLSASSIYYTLKAMTELARPDDYVGWVQFLARRRIAWKTGTSFGFRDGWAIGLNRKHLVAVWVGNADGEGRPGLTGTTMAAPLMFAIFNQLSSREWFDIPTADLEAVSVCRESGFKAADICPNKVNRYYPTGAGQTRTCTFHRLVQLDRSATYRVNSNCYPVSDMQQVAWFVATPTQEYFFKQHSLAYKPLPDYLPGCINEAHIRQMDLVYPHEGFKLYVPVDQNENRGRCIFKAAHKNSKAIIYWYLDGQYLGSTQEFHQYAALPGAGKHTLEITDNTGESQQCRFEVVEK